MGVEANQEFPWSVLQSEDTETSPNSFVSFPFHFISPRKTWRLPKTHGLGNICHHHMLDSLCETKIYCHPWHPAAVSPSPAPQLHL